MIDNSRIRVALAIYSASRDPKPDNVGFSSCRRLFEALHHEWAHSVSARFHAAERRVVPDWHAAPYNETAGQHDGRTEPKSDDSDRFVELACCVRWNAMAAEPYGAQMYCCVALLARLGPCGSRRLIVEMGCFAHCT